MGLELPTARARRAVIAALPWLLWALLSGCGENAGVSALLVQIVDPAGENPAADIVSGTVHMEVRQGERVLRCNEGDCETSITGGDFSFDLPLESFDRLTTIQVRMEGGEQTLVGAVPGFRISDESLDTGLLPVRIVVAPAGTCQLLTLDGVASAGPVRLAEPVRDAGVAIRRNQALIVGGQGAEGPLGNAIFLDQIVMMVRVQEPVMPALGPARGVTISEDFSLFTGNAVVLFEPQQGPPLGRLREIEGADHTSSLVSRGNDGAAVIGGASSSLVTWIDVNSLLAGESSLTTPRSSAAAAPVHGGVLVVGGQAEGQPGGEWLAPLEDGVSFEGLPAGRGGYLVPSPSGQTALWIGFSRADGTLSDETLLISGCPDCAVAAGPVWARARPGSAGTSANDAFWLMGGEASELTDRVLWDGETPRLVDGPNLIAAREGATAFAHAGGIVTVVGGLGDDGLRDDIELCFPDALDPI